MIRNLKPKSLSPLLRLSLAECSGSVFQSSCVAVGNLREHWTDSNLARDVPSTSLGRLDKSRRLFGSGSSFGKHHHERKLLGYTQEQLYAVVSDVSNYKEFVPWCQRSVVTDAKPPDYMEAELEVGFKMFVERYTSQVYMTEPSKVLSKVSDSTLFDHLDTTWEFKAGPTPSTTWLNFDLAFAFKSPLYRQIASVFFDEVVKRMMAAFEQRCKVLYGESALHQKRRMQA